MRKNAAIDEELTELGARLQTLQRNIAAKRLARGSIKSAEQHRRRPDNLRYSDMLDLRQSGELEAGRQRSLRPLSHDISRKCAPAKDLRSIYSWRSQRGSNPHNRLEKKRLT